MSDHNDDDNVFRNGYIIRSLKTDCNVAKRKFDLVCNYKNILLCNRYKNNKTILTLIPIQFIDQILITSVELFSIFPCKHIQIIRQKNPSKLFCPVDWTCAISFQIWQPINDYYLQISIWSGHKFEHNLFSIASDKDNNHVLFCFSSNKCCCLANEYFLSNKYFACY